MDKYRRFSLVFCVTVPVTVVVEIPLFAFVAGAGVKPEPEVDELAYLMGMFVANNDESTTRAKIIKAMLSLDDDGWKFIESLVEQITK